MQLTHSWAWGQETATSKLLQHKVQDSEAWKAALQVPHERKWDQGQEVLHPVPDPEEWHYQPGTSVRLPPSTHTTARGALPPQTKPK